MNKLCLSTYLNVLKIYENPQMGGLNNILNALVNSICKTPQNIPDYEITKLKKGAKNISGYVMDQINDNFTNPLYSENAKRKLYQFLNPSKLSDIAKVLAIIILEDDTISDDCNIDYVSHTRKSDLQIIKNDFDFIIGIFLYILKCTDNVHTEIYSSAINKDFCNAAIEQYNSSVSALSKNDSDKQAIMDYDIPSKAKSFCRKYEKSIDLLPLCQIANIVNPSHNHVNKMYSDYCDCSKELREQIMKEIDCPMIQVDDKYSLYCLLDDFSDEMVKLELIPENNKYMFSQYVIKSLYYEKNEPADINPTIFPKAPSNFFPNHKASTLSQFIDDYLYYKDKGIGFTLPVPFEWMWFNLGLSDCPEKDLIHWLNLFIISCCYNMPKHISNENNKYKSLITPTLYDVKTIEDLNFLALLMLYDTYLCE